MHILQKCDINSVIKGKYFPISLILLIKRVVKLFLQKLVHYQFLTIMVHFCEGLSYDFKKLHQKSKQDCNFHKF